MKLEIDNIKLDEDNVEFKNALEFIQHTDKIVYLTGKAGTGKTTFLKYIREITDKNAVVLAPTGVAAINARGVTINSFFQIPFGPFLPDDPRLRISASGYEDDKTIYDTFRYNTAKREIIENLELLIIDEISMVRSDTIDVIDTLLRVFRKKSYLPFGGVQVILIGDMFQLPPVVKKDIWTILSQFYKTPFFFSSKALEDYKFIYIELKKIYRQNEQSFIDLLNKVRKNKLTDNDFTKLNSRLNQSSNNDEGYIVLATHRAIVERTNSAKLNSLETEQYTFMAHTTGEFPENKMPTNEELCLKVGAQVMFVKNGVIDNKKYYNGKIGKIKELEEDKIIVELDYGSDISLERTTWDNVEYTYNKEEKKIEERIIGTFTQFPVRLAWAITVHKSQGLTFEKVIADLGNAFAHGQVYVALSRCTSFEGLILKTRLNRRAIITDTRIADFAQNETTDDAIA